VSGSLLTAAGLPDLVTFNLSDYERLAQRLALDTSFMQDIRARVAHARDHSPLFDSTKFTDDLERLYVSLIDPSMNRMEPLYTSQPDPTVAQ
jgi:protein O-GlcNAc transferase